MSDTKRAETRHVPQIVDLINKAFEVERFFVEGPRASAEQIGSLMEKGTFFLTEDSASRISGCVYVERRSKIGGYIGLLAVDPSAQQGGIGSRLMEAAEQWLKQSGAREVEISVVNLRQELPPFYEHRGYRAVGTAPFTDKRATRRCHFIIMSKPLAGSA
jgi:GNAT superfamily N-acetyltransferase